MYNCDELYTTKFPSKLLKELVAKSMSLITDESEIKELIILL